MKPVQLHLIFVLINSFSSIHASPIEPSFSQVLKNPSTRAEKTPSESSSSSQDATPSINSALLREFITQFLRALRSTLAEASGDAATNKLEQRQGSGTSRFLFPESEQVKQRSSPSTEPRHARGSVNMAKIEKVAKPSLITKNGPTTFQSTLSTQVGLVRKARTDPNSEAPLKIGKPSTIMSQPLRIIDGPRDGKRGRSLKEIDVQGVKIIVGERVPDSPEDKFFTWRNARVIKGTLIPNGNGQTVKSQPSSVIV